MADRIQIRRDTAANWVSVNPTLAQGEIALETDTGRIKFGNGTSAWNSLGYAPFFLTSGGSIAGNLDFTGTGRRITGDFSNATQINRLLFQSSTANASTSVGAIPNGTSQNAAFNAYSSSDPANASLIQVRAGVDTGEARIASLALGTGTLLPLTSYMGGTKNTEQPVAGGFLVTGGALGYGTGTGGTVTQATSKSTGVTLNKPNGQIVMNAQALAANTSVAFGVTNSFVAANDSICASLRFPGAGQYQCFVSAIYAGGLEITVRNNTGGSLSDAVVINFSVIKGTTS